MVKEEMVVDEALQSTELLQIPGSWNLAFSYAAGKAASRFLVNLRDNQVLLASSCPSCGRVYVPARAYCEDCFVPTSDDWVEVGPGGTLEAFTICYVELSGYPKPPYAVGYVRPDGAGTAMANLVEGVDLSEPGRAAELLAIGTRWKAAFKPERAGQVTDFVWVPA